MEWTPINKDCPGKEELPARYKKVLISVKDTVFEAYRSGDVWYVTTNSPRDLVKSIFEVDAWMPKPKPYRG